MKDNSYIDTSQRQIYILLFGFSTILFFLSFLFNSPLEIWQGSIEIIKSPANLITDYFELANVGAALINASVMAYLSIATLWFNRVKVNGAVLAAVFTVAGFSLFGKNLYNSLPIIFGVLIYSKLNNVPFKNYILVAMFGTSLGPLVSEITFNLNLSLLAGITLGVFAGFIAGLVLPVLSDHFIKFHKGFNLYNIGFTTGIIGTIFIGLLRNFGISVDTVFVISSGNNLNFSIVLYTLFLLIFLIGLYLNNWNLKGYKDFLKQSGKSADFLYVYGLGLCFVNMALLGVLSTSYVLLVGGELCGPVIGGIFTVVGFGAFGKHIKNVLPVLLGIYLVSRFDFYDINSTQALLAALFGTTLAPISGYYGPVAGMIAGGLHVTMSMNISYLHAGMNLYNNGFSGGIVAATMVPILDNIVKIKKLRKNI